MTPWTAAYQAPLSMGFSRQEYWSGVVANFYNLKTEKISTGMVALGDWLRCYRMDNRVDIYLWGQGTGQFISRGSWQQLLWGWVRSRDFCPVTLV